MKDNSSKSILIGKDIKIPNSSIYGLFEHRSKLNASKIVLRCHEDELIFSKLQSDSEIYAKAFMELGVKSGDIVPMCIEPSCAAVVLFFALNRIGAISTFINATATTKEVEHYIQRFHSDYFIYSDKLRLDIEAMYADCKLKKSIKIRKREIYGKYSNPSKLTLALMNESENSDKISTPLEEIYELGKSSSLAVTNVSGSSVPAFIAYTSGTTGEPKSILLTNGNIMAEMISLKKTTHMQFGPKGNSLQVVPFNYPYGFIISVLFPIYVGKTAALTPSLTVETISEYLAMYKPKYISAIPSFYKSLLNDSEVSKMDLSFLRYPVSGGDVITKTEIEDINAFFKKHGSNGKLLNGSGNGEGCGSLTNPIALFEKYNIDSIGKPIYGLSVKFVDENGNAVEKTKIGRFCFSGKNVMLGYYNDELATASVKYTDSDGIEWFHTDTFGHIDKYNWVYFNGRERRFFITYDISGSPYKVYCEHVQNIIKKHCQVNDCVVVKRSNLKRYFVPIAFVVATKSDLKNLKEEIDELCKKDLPNCAVPCEYFFLDSLPLLNSGKIDYKKLEQLAENQYKGE